MKRTLIKTIGLQALILPLLLGFSSDALSVEDRSFISIEKERGLPMRGQSSASVRERFGEPQSTRAPVGNPPISSWHYQDYKVYFEYDLVITTVADDDQLPASLGQNH
jgi:hypothetical protein